MSKTVFLHIGTAKTGTTALQRFLPENSGILNNLGFDHPIMPFHFPRMSDGRNAHFLTLWDDTSKYSSRWNKGFEVIRNDLSEYDNIILSDEVLWAECAREGFLERVCEGFSHLDARLKVIVYLRRQDEMAESHWNQMVKGKLRLTEGFNDFVKSGRYQESFPLDYGKGLDAISQYIEKENIIVRAYEKQQYKDGSLFSDFLDCVGLDLTRDYKLPEYVINTRLPENVVEIKRWINMADSYRSDDVPNFYREILKSSYSLDKKDDIPQSGEGRFSDEERSEFMASFKDSNSYVAREYLNRADGRLFFEETKSLPKWSANFESLLQDAVRVLAGADVYEYTKRRQLEHRVRELETLTASLSDALDEALDRISQLESNNSGFIRRLRKK